MELNYKEFKIKQLFLNILLKKGKKNNSEKIYQKLLIDLKKSTNQKPTFILLKSIQNLSPKLKAIGIPNKKKRKKKKDRFFLIFLNKEKQIKTSILLLLQNIKLPNLYREIIKTAQNKSKSINLKKKIYHNIQRLEHNLNF